MTGTPDKIDRARGPVRKFNPGTLQSDREVIEQFVVREPELQTVLDVLRGNIDSPSCQHVLVVAPRGRGKTMLLARAAAELRTNEEFSKFLLPVRFMEESLEIFNLADFWLETLFHLAGEIADTHPGNCVTPMPPYRPAGESKGFTITPVPPFWRQPTGLGESWCSCLRICTPCLGTCMKTSAGSFAPCFSPNPRSCWSPRPPPGSRLSMT